MEDDLERTSHNRLRQLQGLVAIDAWHDVPEPGSRVADLHVYAHFDEARLGGQVEDSVAFRMVLRRAELRVSQTEPASFRMDPAGIWRGGEDPKGKVKQTERQSSERSRKFEAKAELRPAALSASASGKLENERSHGSSLEVETEQALSGISVSFQRNDRATPTWLLKATGFATHPEGVASLQGLPWSADQQKMLRLVKKEGWKGDDSDVRVTVACRREDLHFYDIHVRGADGDFSPVRNDSPMRVVIEEYLRNALTSEGLPCGDMSSMFSHIILGVVLSEPRHPDDW